MGTTVLQSFVCDAPDTKHGGHHRRQPVPHSLQQRTAHAAAKKCLQTLLLHHPRQCVGTTVVRMPARAGSNNIDNACLRLRRRLQSGVLLLCAAGQHPPNHQLHTYPDRLPFAFPPKSDAKDDKKKNAGGSRSSTSIRLQPLRPKQQQPLLPYRCGDPIYILTHATTTYAITLQGFPAVDNGVFSPS